jgi:hypothetical protein
MEEFIPTWDSSRHGLTPRIVQGPRFQQVTHGVHARRELELDLASRCRGVQRILPSHAMFSHYTAARLRGWWLPTLPHWLPIFTSLPGGGSHLHRRDVYFARTDEATMGVEVREGLRIAPACSVLAQLARDLSLLDLVAVVDAALHFGDCTKADLRASIRPRQWGGARLRRALSYADGRSESWWETPLRLLHRWSGIDVEPQYEVRDDRGHFVARGDVWIVGTRRLAEYDGTVHDEQVVRRRDLRRDKALGRIDWERYGYIARDIVGGPEQIIHDAESALGWPHRPERLKRWWTEVAQSTLRSTGRRRLVRRLERFDRR